LDFTIVLINFDSGPYIEPCLERLRRQSFRGEKEIIVVNHRSTDGSLEILKRQPDIRLLDPGKNLGFSGGNNLGIRSGAGRYVLCLNFDCWLTEGFLDHVYRAFEENPQVGMISGKLRKLIAMKESNVLDSTGIDFTCLTPADRGEWELDDGTYDRETTIFGPSGAAACYRRAALDQVAYQGTHHFDEQMFIYCEDIDLAWRLNLAGWLGLYVPTAVAYHERGSTRRARFWRHVGYYVIGFRNRYYTILKNLRRRDARGYVKKFLAQELWSARTVCGFNPLKWLMMGGVMLLLIPMLLRPSFWGKRRSIRRHSRAEPLDLGLDQDIVQLNHARHRRRVDRPPGQAEPFWVSPDQRLKRALARRMPRTYAFAKRCYRAAFPAQVPQGTNLAANLAECRRLPLVMEGKPPLIYAEISTICNLRCRMCSRTVHGMAPEEQGFMRPEVFDKLADLFAPGGTLAMFGRGETLLHPDFPAFLRLAKDRGMKVCFNTNGKVLTRPIAKAIAECGQDAITVSCSAGTPGTYERIHCGGRWDRLWENISGLLEAKARCGSGRPSIYLEFVVQRDNIHELPSLIERAIQRGLQGVLVIDMVAHTNEQDLQRMNQPDTLPIAEEFYARAAAVKQSLRAISPDFDLRFPASYDAMTKKFSMGTATEQLGKVCRQLAVDGGEDVAKGMCFEPWQTFYVRHSGAVAPCCITNRNLGDLGKDSAADIWNGPDYQKFRARMRSPDKPFECLRCHLFPGPQRYDKALDNAATYEPL